MKRYLLLVLLALASLPAWAASANLTANATSCPATTNTTALVYNMPQDKGAVTLTVTGTWTGTISFYGTGSGGSVWTALNATPLNSTTAATSTTGNGTWQANVAGFTGVCMLSSASMTGTATVTITSSSASAKTNGASGGSGVTSIATSSPITGGTITTTGTIACPTCVVTGSVAWTNITGSVTWTACTAGAVTCTSGSAFGSTVTITSIPATYTNLQLVIYGAVTGTGAQGITIIFNNDSGSHYSYSNIQVSSTGASSITQTGGGSNVSLTTGIVGCRLTGTTDGTGGQCFIDIGSYANTSFKKALYTRASNGSLANAGDYGAWYASGSWNQTTAINEIDVTAGGAVNFAANTTFALYAQK